MIKTAFYFKIGNFFMGWLIYKYILKSSINKAGVVKNEQSTQLSWFIVWMFVIHSSVSRASLDSIITFHWEPGGSDP